MQIDMACLCPLCDVQAACYSWQCTSLWVASTQLPRHCLVIERSALPSSKTLINETHAATHMRTNLMISLSRECQQYSGVVHFKRHSLLSSPRVHCQPLRFQQGHYMCSVACATPPFVVHSKRACTSANLLCSSCCSHAAWPAA
jgi:hypothetical protein